MHKPKKSIASTDLHYLCKDLQGLVGAKVDSFYQHGKDDLVIVFHLTGQGRKILSINTTTALYFTEAKETYETPTGFCTYLRKYLGNTRVVAIEQIGFERILCLTFSSKEETYKLYLEFIPPGNIILTKDGIILSATHYENYRDRTIRPQGKYQSPEMKYSASNIALSELRTLLNSSKKESIVLCLATELGLGGVYAEELCLRSDIPKITPPTQVDAENLHKSLRIMLAQAINTQLISEGEELIDVVPFSMKLYENCKQESIESFSLALQKYFTSKRPARISSTDAEQKKLHAIVETQQKTLAELIRKQEEDTKKGEMLYLHYQPVQEFLSQVKEMAKREGFSALATRTIHGIPIRKVNGQKKSVIIGLE